MKLYNTLSRQIEEIKPINPPVVTVYTCGPTVYDFPHVGNWFTFIRYDLLVRTLQLSGLKPKWVMNVTDVGHLVSDADSGEDKLEKGARREHKTAWEVAAYYTEYFIDGLQRLNFRTPDHLPRATEHIQEQIDLIRRLDEKGYTYVISDGVYYDTARFPRYADFARLDLDEQQPGARVEFDPEKRSVADFALWKFSPKDHQRDMEWESPWGRGFPGWHIECSAMSMKYLGETLDVHAGGIDHIPVHHTNEIAQSEAVTGKPLAAIWMHTNHISVEGEKISKSLDNGVTLEDIEAHGVSLAAFRLHVFESHYRSQSKFSWESLEAAQHRLKRWQQMADLRFQIITADKILPISDAPKNFHYYDQLAADHPASRLSEAVIADFDAALQNDLDTPKALASIERLWNAIEADGMLVFYKTALVKILTRIDEQFGINLFSDDITDTQKAVIAEREAVRAAKDWTTSDKLRDQLQADGIGLRDNPQGTVWYHL